MTSGSWLQRGKITEIVGPLGSGRTSVLIALLRDATTTGAIAALVDPDATFDPVTAGAALDRLARCSGLALVALEAGETPPRLTLTQAFRLRQAARRADVAVVLVGRERIAGSGAALAVRTRCEALAWAGPRGRPTRLVGMGTALHVMRNQGAPPTSIEHRWWTA